jgi:acetyl-CoA C-acetyltransferase
MFRGVIMNKVYIVAAKRTATGSFLGALKHTHPADIATPLVKAILGQVNLKPDLINEVIVGNILPAGAGQGLGRQIALKSGLPHSVVGYTINMACGSAMKAIIQGLHSIQVGQADLILAGGVESMSRAPFMTPADIRQGKKMGDFKLVDHMIYDALTDAFNGVHMGVTAENIALKYGITRDAQDQFAYQSQLKAIAAIDGKQFEDEIVPVMVKEGKELVPFKIDEYPNRTTNLSKMAALKPVFKEGGTVTAANASGLNDGASMVLLASEAAIKQHNLTPLVEIVGYGQGGVDPLYMGLGPTPAVEQALKMAKLTLKDIALIELNEAFAAQSLGVIHELSLAHGMDQSTLLEKTNVKGGAIALGHAVGSSGARITVTLIHEMKKRQAKYGLATLCIGGGMGIALVVKGI